MKAAKRPGNRRRMAVFVSLLLLGFSPALLIAGASFHFRHRPYTIPPEQRAPAPPVRAIGGLKLRWLGVTGYVLSDGKTTLVLDPAMSRYRLTRLLSGPIDTEPKRVQKLVPKADFILINHSHYDHIIDLPEIAKRTGATVVGSPSTLNLARSRGIPESKLRLAKCGDSFQLGSFQIDVRRSHHPAIAGIREPMSGVIPKDAGELWFFNYTLDGSLSYRIRSGSSSLWFHPASTYQAGELGGLKADTLICGVNGEPMDLAKAHGLLQESGARLVIPSHFDNFFQPFDAGLALFPGIDLSEARSLFRAVRPKVAWWVLDYNQEVWLRPGDE